MFWAGWLIPESIRMTVHKVKSQIQTILDAFYTLTINDPIPNLYEDKVTSGSGYDNSYYSNQSFPVNNIEMHTINYFDDYHFDTAGLTLPTPS